MKAWVIGIYGDNGGNLMNYYLANVLYQRFGCEVISVGIKESQYSKENVFGLEKIFSEVSIDYCLKKIKPEDIIVSNPSFSELLIGFKASCKKIMYVQGFNTFKVLDAAFDHYVAVSAAVQAYLKSLYGINSRIISACINSKKLPEAISFDSKENQLVVHLKYGSDFTAFFLDAILLKIADIFPVQNVELIRSPVDQMVLYNKINESKYLLSLSITEGFGLIPLEAMSLGSIVFGFNGIGGRDYMRTEHNCMTVEYPQIELLMNRMIRTFNDPGLAERISLQAMKDADKYDLKTFEKKWVAFLEEIL